MSDTGPRAEARKALRDYDNPKGGRNKNYLNVAYLQLVLDQYKMTEQEPKGKRSYRWNVYGNFVGYIGTRRWMTFANETDAIEYMPIRLTPTHTHASIPSLPGDTAL